LCVCRRMFSVPFDSTMNLIFRFEEHLLMHFWRMARFEDESGRV
jgi:hypothetical protein